MQQPREIIGMQTAPVRLERRPIVKTVLKRAGYASVLALRQSLNISESTMKTVVNPNSKLDLIEAHIKMAKAANMSLEEYFNLLISEQ